MKNKFSVAGAIMFAGTILLFSCEKKQEIQPQVQPAQEKQDVSVKNGRLVFKDRTAFETYSTELGTVPENTSLDKFLDEKENNLGFISMRSSFDALESIPNARKMSEQKCIQDEYMASMLSPEGIL